MNLALRVFRVALACAAMVEVGCESEHGAGEGDLAVNLEDMNARPPAVLKIDPLVGPFGSVVKDTTSAPITFTVTNVGGDASGVLAASIVGGEFAIQTDGCQKTLAPMESCTVAATFHPTSAGAQSGTLQVAATPGGTVTASLTGEGILPGSLMVATNNNGLGSVVVGATGSTASTVTVTNTGALATGPLTVQATGSDPVDFSKSNDLCQGQTLAAGAMCTFQVRLTPKSRGAKSASFEIGASPGGRVSAALTGTGLSPAQLAIVPGELLFGSVEVNQASSNVTVTVVNTGDVDTGTLAVSKTGADQAMFSTSGCAGTVLTPGMSCAIDLTFTPGSTGAKLAQLHLDGTPGGSVAAILSGTGISATQLSIAPTAHGFAATSIGQTSASQVFTITNKSATTSGAITTTFIGSGASRYRIVDGTDTCNGVSLAAATSCSVAVVFAPTLGGEATASLLVGSVSAGTVTAGLSGVGLAPSLLVVSPMSKDFGSVRIGTMTAAQTFTITNTGGITSGVPASMLGGADASLFEIVADGCTAALAPQQSCIVLVRFKPTAAATAAATLTVSATPGGSAPVALLGEGVPADQILITPSTFTFPSTTIGDSWPAQTFTVRNDGTTTTGAIDIAESGHAGDFTTTSDCTTLAPGATCTVTVTFDPTATGVRSAKVSASSSPGGAAYTALSGTGRPRLEIVSLNGGAVTDPFDFDKVVVNSSIAHDLDIVVRNNTIAAQTLALDETFGGQYSTVANTCAGTNTIDGNGGTCEVRVRFSPTSTGVKLGSATFSLGSGTANEAVQNLTGTGIESLTITPVTTAAFGNVPRNTTSSPLTFRVTNPIGSVASGPIITSLSGTGYQLGTDTCNTQALPGGASCTIDVTFTPAGNGALPGSLGVSATPGGSPSQTLSATGVDPVGSPPTDITLTPSSVTENQPSATTVGTLSSVDPDAGNTFTYALVAGAGSSDNASFAIVGSTVRTAASFDLETKGSYSIRVRSTDSGGQMFEKALTITITNVNEAPTDIALSSSTVAENQAAGTAVGSFSSTDPDAGNTFTYTLVAGTGSADNASFTISGNQLLAAASFNFEAKSSYSVRVRTTDAGGLFFEKAFTITVTNVNEAPTDIALSSSTVAENQAAGTAVGSFSSTDPDAGNTFTYALVAGTGSTDNASFTISGNQLLTVAGFNFEAKSSYAIRLRSTDNGGLFFEKQFTITVTNVNEAPTDIALSSSTVAENQAAGTAVGSFSSTDPDAGNTFTYALVAGTGSADNASFTISGNQLLTAASFNFEAKSSYAIRVRSTDNGGLFFEKQFTITVTNVNEAPTDIALSSTAVAENQAAGTAVGNFSSTDPDAGNTFTYALVAGTGSTDNASFTISGNQLLTAASFNFEAKSSYAIRVRSTDNGGLFFEKQFTITVTNVNEAPAVTSNGGGASASISIAENTNAVTTVTATDPDGTSPTYSISGGADAAKFSINSSTGVLTFVAAPDFEAPTDSGANNVYDVTVQASDGTLSDTQAIAVTVTNVAEVTSVTTKWTGTVPAAAGVSELAVGVALGGDGNPAIIARTGGGNTWYTAKHNGSTGAVMWSKTLVSGNATSPQAIVSDVSGNVTVSGLTGDFSGTVNIQSVGYASANGTQNWSQTYGTSLFDSVGGMEVDASGNVAVVALTTSNTVNHTRKSNSAGGLVFQSSVASNGAKGVAFDSAGNVITVGSISNTDTDAYVKKHDKTSGSVLWQTTLTGNTAGTDRLNAVAVDGNGDVIACGQIRMDNSGTISGDIFVVKLNGSTGAEIWRRVVNGAGSVADEVFDVAITAAGDPVVVGRIGVSASERDIYAAKLSGGTGAVTWSRTISGAGSFNDEARYVALDSAGDAYFVATIGKNTGNDFADHYTAKLLGSTGATQWSTQYNGPAARTDQVGTTGAGPGIVVAAVDTVFVLIDTTNATPDQDAILLKYAP